MNDFPEAEQLKEVQPVCFSNRFSLFKAYWQPSVQPIFWLIINLLAFFQELKLLLQILFASWPTSGHPGGFLMIVFMMKKSPLFISLVMSTWHIRKKFQFLGYHLSKAFHSLLPQEKRQIVNVCVILFKLPNLYGEWQGIILVRKPISKQLWLQFPCKI